MTFEDLVDFIENRMDMSNIYQLLLIKSLVESDWSVEQKAHLKMLCEQKLQVLCSKCNPPRNRKDDTDFRDDLIESRSGCQFCYDNIKPRIVEEFNSVVAIEDGYPVSEGHLLIIPKRHCSDFFTMTQQEQSDANIFLKILQKKISENDSAVTGFNVGMNTGESAGQTIFHCHIHLIPRRDGDTPDPRGGVRGVIPDKMSYPYKT